MAITIRYQIHTQWATIIEMREFFTQSAATTWLNNYLPKDARNIDIWVDSDTAKEPRQDPTWYREPKLSTKWWDANKRPFSDRLDDEDLPALSIAKVSK